MATYEYECPGDGKIIIVERPINEPEGKYACGLCGAKLVRVYSAPAIKFNGTGFYKTDNK
jgi:putative FmdB family regulatory protein